jgi:hypothetical protein
LADEHGRLLSAWISIWIDAGRSSCQSNLVAARKLKFCTNCDEVMDGEN